MVGWPSQFNGRTEMAGILQVHDFGLVRRVCKDHLILAAPQSAQPP